MPRPGPRRPKVTFRVSEDDLRVIDRLAAAAGLERSEMIRQLIALAIDAVTNPAEEVV